MKKKKKNSYLLRTNLVNKNKTGGITLIALVITIIVLLILAAVSIATLTGDNGILTKAQNASKKTKEETEKEQIKVAYDAALTDKMAEGKKEVTAEELEKELQKIEPEATATDGTNEGEIEVTFPSGNKYTLDSNGKITGPTNDGSGSSGDSGDSGGGSTEQGVVPEFNVEVGEYDAGSGVTITVEVTNEVGEVDSITITNLDTGDTYKAEINEKTGSVQVERNGTYKIEVKATTEGVQKTGEKTVTVDKIPVTFTTAQGRIDIIWVNKANQKIDEPLVPDTLPSGMKKVYWKEDGTEVKEGDGDFTESKWYSYEEGKGSDDNTSSKWANAINTTTIKTTTDVEESYESYFVWIPRYAYRITYLTTDGQVAGYCDGDGIRDIAGNKKPATQNVKEDKEIETVEYNGFNYIVHPAFEGNIENGGWKDEEKGVEDLAGIWIGKYESVNVGSNKIKIVQGEASWRMITIGNCYTNAYNYDRDKESHLMKNSEWGAVSYLTHSQYGRNGHEISVNESSNYITGNGTEGKDSNLASSTGNKFGVFDLSGGAYEYVAAFNEQDTNNYETAYGNEDFPGADKKITKYATKYSSTSDEPSYDSYIPGDATYEVYAGSSKDWLGDGGVVVASDTPFFIRGGRNGGNAKAGVFSSASTDGYCYNNYSFRVVLPGA